MTICAEFGWKPDYWHSGEVSYDFKTAGHKLNSLQFVTVLFKRRRWVQLLLHLFQRMPAVTGYNGKEIQIKAQNLILHQLPTLMSIQNSEFSQNIVTELPVELLGLTEWFIVTYGSCVGQTEHPYGEQRDYFEMELDISVDVLSLIQSSWTQ